MSIAAANLWTRNIYKAFINPDATPKQEATAEQARLAGGEVRRAGVRARPAAPSTRSTSSCSAASGSCRRCRRSCSALYTRWFHRWALLAGWAVGMAYGTWTAYSVPVVGQARAATSAARWQLVPFTDTKVYIALTAFVDQPARRGVLTFVFRAMKVAEGVDQTRPSDYHADAGDPGVEDVLEGEPGTAPTTR